MVGTNDVKQIKRFLSSNYSLYKSDEIESISNFYVFMHFLIKQQIKKLSANWLNFVVFVELIIWIWYVQVWFIAKSWKQSLR